MNDRTIGLLLQSLPFMDSHRILKILTPNHGLTTLIARHVASKNNRLHALITPFLVGEWVYRLDHKDIHPLKDGTVLQTFDQLKTNYSHLAVAGQIAQDLLRTQLPGKAAQIPFDLACACLNKLPIFLEPLALLASFRLKLLSYEGLLHFEPTCTRCGSPSIHFLCGESFCLQHTPSSPLLLSAQELPFLHAKSFSELAAKPIKKDTYERVEHLFKFLVNY